MTAPGIPSETQGTQFFLALAFFLSPTLAPPPCCMCGCLCPRAKVEARGCVLLSHSLPYSLETRSHTEPGAGPAASKPQRSSCLYLSHSSGGIGACVATSPLLHGYEGLAVRPAAQCSIQRALGYLCFLSFLPRPFCSVPAVLCPPLLLLPLLAFLSPPLCYQFRPRQ